MATQSTTTPVISITTPRLVLRTPLEADAEAYLALLQEPQNDPYGKVDPDLTVDKIKERLARFADMATKGKSGFLVLTLRETGQVIGLGGFNTFEEIADPASFLERAANRPDDTAIAPKRMTDLGLLLDHTQWRKGYGLEALCGLIENAIDERDCTLFRTETDLDNVLWQGLMRAAGVEAYRSQQHTVSKGKEFDYLAYKFDADDWAKAKEGLKAASKWYL